jgi:hypothetical protein
VGIYYKKTTNQVIENSASSNWHMQQRRMRKTNIASRSFLWGYIVRPIKAFISQKTSFNEGALRPSKK